VRLSEIELVADRVEPGLRAFFVFIAARRAGDADRTQQSAGRLDDEPARERDNMRQCGQAGAELPASDRLAKPPLLV